MNTICLFFCFVFFHASSCSETSLFKASESHLLSNISLLDCLIKYLGLATMRPILISFFTLSPYNIFILYITVSIWLCITNHVRPPVDATTKRISNMNVTALYPPGLKSHRTGLLLYEQAVRQLNTIYPIHFLNYY